MQFDEGELGGAVDGHEQVELAFGGLHLGDVDVEVADRVALELLLGRLVAFDLRQAADAVALQAAMQGRARQVRDRRLQGIEAVVQRQQRVPRKATMTASSSTDSTVDAASFGPVGRSATEVRFLHLATVFGLIP